MATAWIKWAKLMKPTGKPGDKYKFIEVDITRKKGLAKKYGVTVNADKTACVVELNKGELVREIALDQDVRGQL